MGERAGQSHSKIISGQYCSGQVVVDTFNSDNSNFTGDRPSLAECNFVWIPKYRHKIFEEPYRSELKSIIYNVAYDYDIDIVELEVPTDHIHRVVRSEPKESRF